MRWREEITSQEDGGMADCQGDRANKNMKQVYCWDGMGKHPVSFTGVSSQAIPCFCEANASDVSLVN